MIFIMPHDKYVCFMSKCVRPGGNKPEHAHLFLHVLSKVFPYLT